MKALVNLDLRAYYSSTSVETLAFHRLILETVFEAITRINVSFFVANPDAPLLYSSGVRYKRDPIRNGLGELWLDVPSILRRGVDDCEGLSSYLAAEMRVRAPNSVSREIVPAAAVALRPSRAAETGRPVLGSWHAIVIDRATGRSWDPSRELGMGAVE